jgi:hypothetical protein
MDIVRERDRDGKYIKGLGFRAYDDNALSPLAQKYPENNPKSGTIRHHAAFDSAS